MDMPKQLASARLLLKHIERLGYAVDVSIDEGKVTLTATRGRAVCTVTADLANAYTAAGKLSEQVGVDFRAK